MYFELDGQRHALIGARGTFTIKADSQGIPYFHFTFTGMWVDPLTNDRAGAELHWLHDAAPDRVRLHADDLAVRPGLGLQELRLRPRQPGGILRQPRRAVGGDRRSQLQRPDQPARANALST
jgi:hypothetical protein